MGLLHRFWTWLDRIDESDEDLRARLGLTWDEWYRDIEQPRAMREHGCETVQEYEALLNTWRAEFARKWDEDEKRRDARRRELWPKDKPYRSY